MQNQKKFRENGAVGALLDIYEKALSDLKNLIADVTDTELTTVVDAETKDANCHSIQTILTHLVCSGYAYAIYVRKKQGEDLVFVPKKKLQSVADYNVALDKMFDYNVQMFADYPNLEMEEAVHDKKITTNWGQVFDIDQLYEHAIMHILRHHRQIERFYVKIQNL
jgi:hypothetical protein